MTITVVIPAFNCEAYLAETLRSVQAQSERDLEIIVVDDGSRDGTAACAAAAAAHDPRVRVLSQPNAGPAAARNRALRAATGEYLAFVDGDDLCHPLRMERELAVLRRYPSVGAVFCDVIWFDRDPGAAGNPRYLGQHAFLEQAAPYLQAAEPEVYLCTEGFYGFMSTRITSVATQSVMIRREVLLAEPVWFREDWRVGEDIDLWFRLARRTRLAYIDVPLAYYRHRQGSLTSDPERALTGFIAAHTANMERGRDVLNTEEMRTIRRRLARQYFHLGYLYHGQGRAAESRDAYRRSLSLDPTARGLFAYLKSYVPRKARQHIQRRAG